MFQLFTFLACAKLGDRIGVIERLTRTFSTLSQVLARAAFARVRRIMITTPSTTLGQILTGAPLAWI